MPLKCELSRDTQKKYVNCLSSLINPEKLKSLKSSSVHPPIVNNTVTLVTYGIGTYNIMQLHRLRLGWPYHIIIMGAGDQYSAQLGTPDALITWT